ncbi:MAG: LCP family protein [Candidatus Saccharimonadales bacterium]
MKDKHQDGFRPRRATSIDGFLASPPGGRPRQPVFRGSSTKPEPIPKVMEGMPKRPIPQTIQPSNFDDMVAPPAATSQLMPSSEPFSPIPKSRPVVAPPAKKAKPRRKKRIFKRFGLMLGILILIGGLFVGFKFYKDIARLTGNGNPFSLLGAFHPSPLKNQDGRVNVLVAGNSADDLGHDGAQLTDSIMVLSIDTRNNNAFMLSVPRDLWVNIPGYGHSKINAAFVDGGMDLLQQVIESKLDLTINYQVLVNYSAFQDLVDAIGGITMNIESSDPRGIYDPSLDYTSRNCCSLAKYPNGNVTLDGKQALNLARARGDAYGSYGFPQADFDRTEHQRQMLMAIKTKASQTSVIANPLKVVRLIDAVGNNVRTNLSVGEIETLYSYSKGLNDGNIKSLNVNTLDGKPMLDNYTSPEGQSALIPTAGLDDFSDIQTQLKRQLSRDPVVREGASIVILNGTDTIGLASSQGDKLIDQGMVVEAVADAPANQAKTSLIDNSKGHAPGTKTDLKQRYNAQVVKNETLSATYPNADFILILGQNAVPKPATQN